MRVDEYITNSTTRHAHEILNQLKIDKNAPMRVGCFWLNASDSYNQLSVLNYFNPRLTAFQFTVRMVVVVCLPSSIRESNFQTHAVIIYLVNSYV
jgi:hypothetical protein